MWAYTSWKDEGNAGEMFVNGAKQRQVSNCMRTFVIYWTGVLRALVHLYIISKH